LAPWRGEETTKLGHRNRSDHPHYQQQHKWSVVAPRSIYFLASGQFKHLCNDKQVFIPFYSANTVVMQAKG
jgi:hypothetical protein